MRRVGPRKFLTPPPPASFSNSPELRRIWFMGLGLFALLMIVWFVTPKDTEDSAAETAAQGALGQVVLETPEQRAARVSTLFQGALVTVTDGADFDESVGYFQLVDQLSKYDPAQFSEQTHVRLDWKAATERPAEIRGDFVRLRGLLMDLRTTRLLSVNAPLTDVYRCFVVETDGSEQVVVDLVSRPGEPFETRRDVVDIEGVCYRTVSVEGKDGKARVVPYLIGRTFHVYHAPETGLHGWQKGAMFGGVVLVALIVVLFMARSKPEARRHGAPPAIWSKPGMGIREMMEMRLREEGIEPPSSSRGSSAPKRDDETRS